MKFQTKNFLKKSFTKFKNSYVLTPKEIRCHYKNQSKFGEVGKVIDIKFKKDFQILIVGFIGQTSGDKLVNINADEIVEWFLGSSLDINEVFFLTSTGGLLNNQGDKVHLITDIALNNIIKNKDAEIRVSGGMLKKFQEIKKILPLAAKIVITDIAGVLKEIETWRGNGTLIIDTKHRLIEKIKTEEKILVKEILNFYIKKEIISPLSNTELKEILANHFLFKIKDSPLAGFSAINQKNVLTVKGLWANVLDAEIVGILIDYLKKLAKRNKKKLVYDHQTNAVKR